MNLLPKEETGRRSLVFFSAMLFFLSFIPFANGLRNDFVFDDITIVTENPLICGSARISDIFASDYWGPSSVKTGLYRPLTLVTYAINHRFSKLNPLPYHLTNAIIHSINTILLFFLFIMIFKNSRGALFSSIIFAVHPVHTEAVTWIIGRAELLSFFFSFISLIFFFLALADERSRIRAFFLFLSSYLFLLLALLSKESAIAIPLALLFIVLFRDRKQRNRGVRGTLFDHRWELLGIVAILAFYLLMRIVVFGSPIGSSKPILLDNPLAYVPFWERCLGASRVLFKYIWLLFFPLRLSADYSYNQIPIVGTLSSLVGGLSFFILAGLIILTIHSFRKKTEIFIPLSFFFSSMLIISNFFIITGTIMAERLLYIPSASLCILLGIIFSSKDGPLLKGRTVHFYSFLILALIVLAAMPRTFLRNRDWSNEESLFTKTVQTSPMSAKAHNNLAHLCLTKGDFIRAEKELRIALEIYPDYSQAISNLGTIYEKKGLIDESISLYRRAIQLSPGFPLAYSNLGNVLQKKGDFVGALTAYRQAISIDPRYADAFYNLGNTLALHNAFRGALYNYRRALEIDPDYKEALNNMGMALRALGDKKEAEEIFLKALRISPKFHNALFNIGRLYAEEGRYAEAVAFLQRAMKEDENHLGTLMYLGIVYLKTGNLSKATSILRRAKTIEPNNADLNKLLQETDKMRRR